MPPATLVWFRLDLRLQDNPALHAAIARGGPIIPVYILDDEGEGRWSPGGATRWWLHHSLGALDRSLRALGSRLILARGESAEVLWALGKKTGAAAVFWNRRYEPAIVDRDNALEKELQQKGVEVRTFNGALLREPSEIVNKQGRPFQIFTAYWRHCVGLPVPVPTKLAARSLPAPRKWPATLKPRDLGLLPRVRWDVGFASRWIAGEKAATDKLRAFVAQRMERYAVERDRPDVVGTSMLSPHLHFGEISPRQVWAAVRASSRSTGVFPPNRGASVFLAEVGWREFAYHVLANNRAAPEKPMRAEFEKFPWVRDPRGRRLRAWERGHTGYPIVDAGMRQLWTMGWMHNRVRMIVASFLVKHLRLPWVQGAGWFWDTLVDADLANNTLGWQWSAGCGVDAAPYFRIFAPVRQGRKFDPHGDYVREWVPALRALPAKWIHEPWAAPAEILAAAKVRLGTNYPRPVVDHDTARREALAAFQTMRSRR